MNEFLVQWEQEAINLMNHGDRENAILLFKKITNACPDYEYGICFYHLACCFEDLGKFKEAQENYIKAIEYDGEDHIRLGGYASFLYLHGNASDAFEKYIELIRLEKNKGFDSSNTLAAIKELGKKIGLTENEVIARMNTR